MGEGARASEPKGTFRASRYRCEACLGARSEHRASDVRRASSSECCRIVSLTLAIPEHPLTNTNNCENTHPTHCTTQINHTHHRPAHNKQGVVTLTVKNLQQRIPWFSRR